MSIETAFTQFPSLTTTRLHLRQIQPTDAAAFFAIKSDPEVTTPYGQEPHHSLEETQEWLQRRQADYQRREVLFWAVTHNDEDAVIGSCTFWNFDSSFQCVELGYELHRAYWRQGLMAEAVSAILNYGFTELELHRVEANPLAKNTSSSHLLHKLGFTHEGTLRQRIFFRQRFEDQLYFGLLKEDWLKTVPAASIPGFKQ